VTDDVRAYNRAAWDGLVRAGNRWTVPVSSEDIARARAGEWSVILTPTRPVPRAWFGELRGARVLGLASGGGQQCPLFAAAGARVTVLDNSPAQLAQDRLVADREGLLLETVEGDMRELSAFADGSFDLVFHPCSNAFVPDVRPVWREAHRVLAPGGVLLAGFTNPVVYTADLAAERDGVMRMKYSIPYSDLEQRGDPEVDAMLAGGNPLNFGHTLEDQLGGQCDAGFAIVGLYEDGWDEAPEPVHRFLKCYLATRAVKQ
jgi:SAM-dependent methyltransferase